MCEEESVEYLRDLVHRKEAADTTGGEAGGLVSRLIGQEIRRVQGGGRPPGRDSRLLDVYNERPVRLSAKVSIPAREHPKFNFVGKLLGPRGSSLKQLQEETMTKMAVLGRGSMRNKQQEEELRSSPDPKHGHLREELHVEITAFASPAEAHARLAYALTEVRKYLIPDSNDQIRQQQMREIQVMKRMMSEAEPRLEDPLLSAPEDSGHETDSLSGSPHSDQAGEVLSLEGPRLEERPGALEALRRGPEERPGSQEALRRGPDERPGSQEALMRGPDERPGSQEALRRPTGSVLQRILSLHHRDSSRRALQPPVGPCDCLPYKRKAFEALCRSEAKRVKEVD